MLGKILSQKHGYNCTVLFSINKEGFIDPNAGASLTNPEALDSVDAIVMMIRFRKLRRGVDTWTVGMSHLRFDAQGRVAYHPSPPATIIMAKTAQSPAKTR